MGPEQWQLNVGIETHNIMNDTLVLEKVILALKQFTLEII